MESPQPILDPSTGGPPPDDPPTGPRKCLRCFLVHEHCLCDRIPSIANRTRLLVLQHPRERFHPIGTARIAKLGLQRCEVLLARDETGESIAVDPGDRLTERTALLFPDPDAPHLDEIPPERQPDTLCVLDGTWAQARRLFHENAWVRELPRVRFTPSRESEYRIRREPHPHYVSTIEAIVTALRTLEPGLVGTEGLLDAFRAMVARQAEFGSGPGRQPRHQRPRNRPSRVLPEALRDQRLLIAGIDTWSGAPHDEAPRPLQVVLHSLSGSARSFETIVHPDHPNPDADLRKLDHADLGPADLEAGCSTTELVSSLRRFLQDGPPVAAWNERTLRTLGRLVDLPPGSFCLKAAYTNLRGGRIGSLEDVLEQEGLRAGNLPFRGRLASRVAESVAIARFLRAQAEARIESGVR